MVVQTLVWVCFVYRPVHQVLVANQNLHHDCRLPHCLIKMNRRSDTIVLLVPSSKKRLHKSWWWDFCLVYRFLRHWSQIRTYIITTAALLTKNEQDRSTIFQKIVIIQDTGQPIDCTTSSKIQNVRWQTSQTPAMDHCIHRRTTDSTHHLRMIIIILLPFILFHACCNKFQMWSGGNILLTDSELQFVPECATISHILGFCGAGRCAIFFGPYVY